MAWPYSKSVPGITVLKYLKSFTVDIEAATIGFTFAEGEKHAGQDVAYIGQWSSSEDYITDDVVYHSAEYYLALQASSHTDPKEPGESGSETYWEKQDSPGDWLNACGYPYHLKQQREISYNLSFDDFLSLSGLDQGDLTDWILLLGPKSAEGAIYDAYKAAAQEPLPD